MNKTRKSASAKPVSISQVFLYPLYLMAVYLFIVEVLFFWGLASDWGLWVGGMFIAALNMPAYLLLDHNFVASIEQAVVQYLGYGAEPAYSHPLNWTRTQVGIALAASLYYIGTFFIMVFGYAISRLARKKEGK